MERDPYTPPAAVDIETEETRAETRPLATLGQRFFASLLDGLIPLGLVLLFIFGLRVPLLSEALESKDYISEMITSAALYILFLALNFYLIHTRSQTIGKLALGIQVSTVSGKSPSTTIQVGIRYAFFIFCDAIPVIGSVLSLVNILFIFGAKRKCLHDYLAGTIVVQTTPEQGTES